jgi:hypothetical protein
MTYFLPLSSVPAVVKWAAGAMHGGAALTGVWGGILAARSAHPANGVIALSTWWGLAIGFFLGVAGAVPWLWMAWMVLAGRGWARILSTVFFGIYFVSFVPEVVISFLPGHFKTPANSFVVVFVGLEVLFGLAAIILLWQRESSWFFLACKRARAVRILGLRAC